MKIAFRSIAVKNGLLYLAILLVALTILGGILFNNSAQVIRKLIVEQIEHTQDLTFLDFKNYVDDIEKNVVFLGESALTRKVLEGGASSQDRSILMEAFINLLRQNTDYDQIRLISAFDEGVELIRADRHADRPMLVSESDLQKKGDRDYFREAAAMSGSGVLFSQINLNREHGSISQPVKPTLRATYSVFSDTTFIGLVVINLNLTSFFKAIQSVSGPGQNFYLLTNGGDYLVHPDKDLAFGFEYNKPGLAGDMLLRFDQGDETTDRDLGPLFFRDWNYPREGYEVICALGVSREAMDRPLRSVGARHVLYFLISILVFGGLMILLMRRQSLVLSQISSSMTQFSGSSDHKIKGQERKDEIGDLARAFVRMRETISDQLLQLNKEKEIAEMATKEKEAFIQNMSHELRNPLQNIKGMLTVLKKNGLREDQTGIISAMSFSAGQLETLINDVLDLGEIRMGSIVLKPEAVSLPAFLNEIVTGYKYEASLKKISVDLDITKRSDGIEVMMDKIRFNQIMSNLISNAIKYSPFGTKVEVKAKLIDNTDKTLTLDCSIHDQGIGISGLEVEEVVKRFVRLNSSRDQAGSGLGLYIVTQLLELFGSELKITSEKDQGSIFSFSLRLPIIESKSELDKKEDQDIGWNIYWPPGKILIIEDDPQLNLLYTHFFNDVSAQLDLVNELNLVDGQPNFPDKDYDLICSDILLNAVNAASFIREIRASLNEDGLLVFVTGKVGEAQAGFDSSIPVLEKPIVINEIQQAWVDHCEQVMLSEFSIDRFVDDYHDDPEVLERGLGLLDQQWTLMTSDLLDSVKTADHDKLHATYHKLTTTLKRLNLIGLDSVLNEWCEDSTELFQNTYKINGMERLIVSIGQRLRAVIDDRS